MADFDSFDHERHMAEAIALAREAVDRGDRPFGSVLVVDDDILMRESNRVVTESDIRRHPELQLAYRACRELDESTRGKAVMYTSTEPCPMCTGGIRYAGFGRIVYSVGADEIAEFTGEEPATRSTEILDCEVVGGVSNDSGRSVHEAFW
jgi:tRNA(Arg) A34 adenosine deaminase TadA